LIAVGFEIRLWIVTVSVVDPIDDENWKLAVALTGNPCWFVPLMLMNTALAGWHQTKSAASAGIARRTIIEPR
jgi:hypothetical protein